MTPADTILLLVKEAKANITKAENLRRTAAVRKDKKREIEDELTVLSFRIGDLMKTLTS